MSDDIAARCLKVLGGVLVREGDLDYVAGGGDLFTSALLDSLTLLNLVIALENEFGIQIMVENLEDVFASLASLTEYLQDELATL